ncbi:MAG: exo-alpha-sialidase [Clostridia bacterium]|nr:exo-alpha-sialidase [Clostridia bacterium]
MKTKIRAAAAILAALTLFSMASCDGTTTPPDTSAESTSSVPVTTAEPAPEGVTELLSIKELNTNSEVGSHAEDNYKTASMEINFRETVDLRSSNTGFNRYDNAYYPRVKKINENLYLLLFMHGELGPHLYYATSTDGVRWNPPQILFNNAEDDKVISYTDGPLAGTTDRYCATNADACVLDNGEILCVYAVRPNKGYHDYPDYNGLWMRRGTVKGNKGLIEWSEPEKIYNGHAWEPYIWQRDNGQVEIYWTSIVAYATMYGFDEEKRSTCTMMIVSNDNGENWTPNIQPGDKNNYVATRIYQEYIGKKVPFGDYTEAVPYFGGQMPCVTKLYNGKTMIALEIQQLDKTFDISYAVSEADGVWKELGLLEEGPDNSVRSTFDGASPYLACFPSGEVYMTYTKGRDLYYKLGAPDGSEVAEVGQYAAPGTYGFWGSCELVGSHEVITAAQNKVGELHGIQLVHSYLNHRTNAPKTAVKVDGYTEDWTDNTDALFVGSDSQAQITLRTAHDDENIYFLISRLDYQLTSDDTATIRIANGEKTYYRIVVGMDGTATLSYVEGGFAKKQDVQIASAVKVLGTIDDNKGTDEGAVFEIAVPKSAVGLNGASAMQVRPELVNSDGNGKITDSLTDVSANNTALWPSIALN